MLRTTSELERSLLYELIRAGAKGSTLTLEGFTRNEQVAARAALSLELAELQRSAEKQARCASVED